MPGSYDQYCPIARSLDLLGDRWTLLVLRELSLGPQRFTDLRRNLVGIPPNVLSQRLKRLGEDGLVRMEELPPPAARSVYALTPRGREAMPILRALARFGMPALDFATTDRTLPPERVAAVAFVPWFDEAAARELDVDEHYDLRMDDVTQHLVSRPPGMRRNVEGAAAVTVEGRPHTFMRLRQDRTLDAAVRQGDITLTGPKAAITRFRRLFQLPAA